MVRVLGAPLNACAPLTCWSAQRMGMSPSAMTTAARTGPLRDMPHVAYRVDDMNPAIEGQEMILEPFTPMPGLSVAFVKEDGAVIEFMKFEGGATEFAHLR